MEKLFKIKKDLPPFVKTGDLFILDGPFFVKEDETLSIRSTKTTTKLFKHYATTTES